MRDSAGRVLHCISQEQTQHERPGRLDSNSSEQSKSAVDKPAKKPGPKAYYGWLAYNITR